MTHPMDPERWRRVEQLCADAHALEPTARAAWLDRACPDDPALRAEVERLLVELDRDPGFLEQPLFTPPQIPFDSSDETPVPEAIGPYRVERRLGRGGMGDVFLATREADGVHQSVAIKVVRPGMGSDEIVARFRQERRILAGLDHPNIARLQDAGVTGDGRPYFVMELVDGTPIDEYCDDRRLGITERLRLFQIICDAVQHAHQRLVVHRDLKPRNILVSRDGVVKLLDFGIGKVLSNDRGATPHTGHQVRLMTPEYAAPEQVAGGPITTATDVYALGVLLYELLTGRHPNGGGGRSRAELERRVREEPPRRPSAVVGEPADEEKGDAGALAARRNATFAQLRRRLTGDLDTIVLMALRKEPERRYPSAAALAEDIQRTLDGRPVRARPDTFGYRAGRFLRRNAGWSAAAAVAALGLIATASVALVQAERVRQEAARVAAERDKALEVRGFLLEMFGASGADQSVGDTVTVRQLLDLQTANLESAYGSRPELRAEMLEVLADGYDRLGLLPRADSLATLALAARRALHPESHPDLAQALTLAGWIIHERGRSREAEPLLHEAVAIRRRAGITQREGLARSLNDLGTVLIALDQNEEAEVVLQEALDLRLVLLGPEHRAVGITGNNLATAYYYLGRIADAIAAQEIAVRAIRASVGDEHQRTVIALSNLAAFRRVAGDGAGAIATFRELLAIQSRIQGPNHPVTARTRGHLAQALFDRGVNTGDSLALAEADTEYQHATRALEAALGSAHPDVGVAISAAAALASTRGRHREAARDLDRAIRILGAASGPGHPMTLLARARLSAVRWRQGERNAAISIQREVVAGHAGGASRNPEIARARTHARTTLCEYLLGRNAAGDAAEAVTECAEALSGLPTEPTGGRRPHAYLALRLAQALLLVGEPRRADSLIGVAATWLDPATPTTNPTRRLLDSLQSGTRRVAVRRTG